MVTYFARQPIIDQNRKLYAYELLYRRNQSAQTLDGSFDENLASSAVLETFQSMGTERITGGKKAFVNFPQKLLAEGCATLFRKETLVVEVLETVEPTPELLENLAELRRAGYTIALDDFVYRHELQKLMDLADIIKIDFNESRYASNVLNILAYVDPRSCMLLAEKVETAEIFETAKNMGCKLFQGYFFAKPITMSEQLIVPMKFNYLQLIGMVCQQNVDFAAVSRVVRRDVGLSYKVLRLVNSAFFGIRNQIRDIRQAVAFLGERELKKWVSFIAMGGICDNKPNELIRMSLTRAHFCEEVGIVLNRRIDSDVFFLTGLFSLLDALMDADLGFLLGGISTPERTRRALLGESGEERYALDLIIALEQGRWEDITRLCGRLKIPPETVSDIYTNSIYWCNELLLFRS